eukprot:1376263-Amorphochlora_amoeboformis.AAC.1
MASSTKSSETKSFHLVEIRDRPELAPAIIKLLQDEYIGANGMVITELSSIVPVHFCGKLRVLCVLEIESEKLSHKVVFTGELWPDVGEETRMKAIKRSDGENSFTLALLRAPSRIDMKDSQGV